MPLDEDDERDRRATNIFLLVAAVIFIGGGIWLVNAMVDSAQKRGVLRIRPAQLQPHQSPRPQPGLGPRAARRDALARGQWYGDMMTW